MLLVDGVQISSGVAAAVFDTNCKYNEKIILIGAEHCNNIEKVMKKMGINAEYKMTNYDEDPKKCIKKKF